ncbi:MAG: hypothetical protein JNL32_15735, partial [Candidatus Kapabacteria bacterium]|nr:hypothetical protein [Candidatus Kapabacteria bacterium]
NDDRNNLLMKDNSLIIRNDVGTIANHPAFVSTYSVKYIGVREIVTGNEIPADTNTRTLKALTVHNDGGLTMDRNVTANDSITVGTVNAVAHIRTDKDTANKFLLTYTSLNNDPRYDNPKSEVIGSLRRTAMRVGGTTPMLYNNRHTFVQFADASAKGGVETMTINSRPATFPSPRDGDKKVKRALTVTATNALDSILTEGFRYRFGYGWCNVPSNATVNESNGLDISRVILQRWSGNNWENNRTSRVPAQFDTTTGWAFSFADTVVRTGFFAIGLPTPVQLCLNTRIYMEGPYRNGSMVADLRERNLIPNTPPNIYPYNLDPTRATINVQSIPTDVVDWVVVEIRERQSGAGDRFYQTGFLHKDGSIVMLDGVTKINFPKETPQRPYYVVVHHRNHLAVMSNNPYDLQSCDDNILALLDFTRTASVFGGSAALKPVDCTETGQIIFAMVAGDQNGDGKVNFEDRTDYNAIWAERDREEYTNYDTDLSGIVTTRDLNKSWNNRNRQTNVPR